jgi:hypothetical protein
MPDGSQVLGLDFFRGIAALRREKQVQRAYFYSEFLLFCKYIFEK